MRNDIILADIAAIQQRIIKIEKMVIAQQIQLMQSQIDDIEKSYLAQIEILNKETRQQIAPIQQHIKNLQQHMDKI